MFSNKFKYSDGADLIAGDKVLVNTCEVAWIECILAPGSKEAFDYNSPDGGFVLKFFNGDVQVWANTDEDICLIEREETGIAK